MLKRSLSIIASLLIVTALNAANSKTPDLEKNKDLLDKLYTTQYDTTIGSKDAKVVIFDFFDYNCSDCKAIAPLLEELVKNNPEVKVIPIEYPILRPPAMYAAQVAIAALNQGKYAQVHHDFMARVGRFATEEEVDSVAIKDGVDVSNIKSDAAIKSYLFKNLELGHKIGITNVPTLFIGNVAEPHNTSVIVEPKAEELQTLINKYLNKAN